MHPPTGSSHTMHLQSLVALLIITAASVAAPSSASTALALAQTCAGCHGSQGQGGGIFPRLAGQPADYLERQLRNFRSGRRGNSMMQPVAKNLSDNSITGLAEYFSGIKAPFEPSTQPISVAELTRGHELVTAGDWQHGVPACVRCHAPDMGGVTPEIPALAGQPAAYAIAQLKFFRDASGRPFPVMTMAQVSKGLSDADMQAVADYIAQINPGEPPAFLRPPHDATYKFVAESPDNFAPPPESSIPTGPDGDMIWRGLLIFENTQHEAHQYVDDSLNCSSCHMDHGRRADSAPMWAAYVTYPKYREKNHKVNTLEERIQECFLYSMNGAAPAADSLEIKALVTYFHWLATGLPVGITPNGAGYPRLPSPLKPVNISRGAHVFANNCAMCHGDNGRGREVRGQQVFPPLWGEKSFNWGAGMERVSTAAGFIKANMPYGAGGTLSDQDAWDVAAFVVSHPRPQDPRFTGDVEQTRKKYHDSDSYYGVIINGRLLGAPEKPR
jgi:thiosulfate dehydrogenase